MKKIFTVLALILTVLPVSSIAAHVHSPMGTATAPAVIDNPDGIEDIQALPISFGDTNNEVLRQQTYLWELGYLPVPPTGYFGPLTQNAATQFQLDNDIPISGSIDERTSMMLFQQLAEQSMTDSAFQTGLYTPSLNLLTAGTLSTRPRVTLSSSVTTVENGKTFTLTWSGSNLVSCEAKRSWTGALATAGTKTLTATTVGTSYYEISCSTNSTRYKTVTKRVAVNVVASTVITTSTATCTDGIKNQDETGIDTGGVCGGATAPALTTIPPAPAPDATGLPTLAISLPAYVLTGSSATLAWNATGATTCSPTGWSSATPLGTSGTKDISSITASTNVGVKCTNSVGSVVKILNVMPSSITSLAPVADNEPASIASNFDVNAELVPAWGHGNVPASAAPDVVGAFRFICNPSHLGYNDPIVFPGQTGKSHLHQFFGNTLANADSTYESLRKTGMSTCNSPLNRSAYWIPAMINGDNMVVKPDHVSIYYKRVPETSATCQKSGVSCVDLPRGLRFVFGRDMLNLAATPTGAAYYNCDGPTATPGHYPDITTAAKNCPAGNKIGAVMSAPSCWDGKNLDSANHRSHTSYPSYGSWGYAKCPGTHPYMIPTFTLGAWYTVDDTLDRSGTYTDSTTTWRLSSDTVNDVPGATLHADWFGAWDDDAMKMWTDNCINKLLNCSGGDLGNGKQLKMFPDFTWTASPRLVPIPPKP